jgi:hypothetical protein
VALGRRRPDQPAVPRYGLRLRTGAREGSRVHVVVLGRVGTLVFLWAMGRLRGDARWRPTWIGLSIVTLGVWALATIIAIALPVVETAPTRRRSRWARSSGGWLPRCSPRSAWSRACSAAALAPAEGGRDTARVNVGQRRPSCLRYRPSRSALKAPYA